MAIDKEEKERKLRDLWCSLCNYFHYTSDCEKCPGWYDEELCYDGQDCNYDKFENFINSLNDRK